MAVVHFAANVHWDTQMCVGKAHCKKTFEKVDICMTSVKIIGKNSPPICSPHYTQANGFAGDMIIALDYS